MNRTPSWAFVIIYNVKHDSLNRPNPIFLCLNFIFLYENVQYQIHVIIYKMTLKRNSIIDLKFRFGF